MAQKSLFPSVAAMTDEELKQCRQIIYDGDEEEGGVIPPHKEFPCYASPDDIPDTLVHIFFGSDPEDLYD